MLLLVSKNPSGSGRGGAVREAPFRKPHSGRVFKKSRDRIIVTDGLGCPMGMTSLAMFLSQSIFNEKRKHGDSRTGGRFDSQAALCGKVFFWRLEFLLR